METVIACSKIKDWTNQKGEKIPIYSVGLSDGRGGQSFGREIPIGTSVAELTITDKGQYGLDFKLKGGIGNGNRRGGPESFALSYSKDLVVGGKITIGEIFIYADKFFDWIESKKK